MVSPTAETIALGTFDIDPVSPGKTIRLEAEPAIPKATKAGFYYLVVQIDPENNTIDPIIDNNLKFSKKRIEVEKSDLLLVQKFDNLVLNLRVGSRQIACFSPSQLTFLADNEVVGHEAVAGNIRIVNTLYRIGHKRECYLVFPRPLL